MKMLQTLALAVALAGGLCAAPATAQPAPGAMPPPPGAADAQGRPPPPVERVLHELSLTDAQRETVRGLLRQWREEARDEADGRRARHRAQLAEVLNADQVTAVLAALPPPGGPGAPPPPPPMR